MAEQKLTTVLRRRIKEDLSAAFPRRKFVVSKSERERAITIHWCGDDPSEAEVEAIAGRHARDGIRYYIHRFEPCALCGSMEFPQFNDETMEMTDHRDPDCMSCCGDFGPHYRDGYDGDKTIEEDRKEATQRKSEIRQVIKDLHDAFPDTRFTLEAPRWETNLRFGVGDSIYIEWADGPPKKAVKAVVNDRGGYFLHLRRTEHQERKTG